MSCPYLYLAKEGVWVFFPFFFYLIPHAVSASAPLYIHQSDLELYFLLSICIFSFCAKQTEESFVASAPISLGQNFGCLLQWYSLLL